MVGWVKTELVQRQSYAVAAKDVVWGKYNGAVAKLDSLTLISKFCTPRATAAKSAFANVNSFVL
jgi:hypothetical protein